MATMFRNDSVEKHNRGSFFFDVDAELRQYAWHPQMTALEAEAVLADKPCYTYITRPRHNERGFVISFVNINGQVEHQNFSLIDAKYGIWRNCLPDHVGKLGKVICDMMDCEVLDCRPL